MKDLNTPILFLVFKLGLNYAYQKCSFKQSQMDYKNKDFIVDPQILEKNVNVILANE